MKAGTGLIALSLFAASCADPIASPVTSPIERYRSTILVVPAPFDGPDSAHLRGDYIDLSLFASGRLEATTRRSYVHFGAPPFTETTNTVGTYTVRNDSIVMQTQAPTELNVQGWRRNGRNIEIKLGGLGPYHIVLERL